MSVSSTTTDSMSEAIKLRGLVEEVYTLQPVELMAQRLSCRTEWKLSETI